VRAPSATPAAFWSRRWRSQTSFRPTFTAASASTSRRSPQRGQMNVRGSNVSLDCCAAACRSAGVRVSRAPQRVQGRSESSSVALPARHRHARGRKGSVSSRQCHHIIPPPACVGCSEGCGGGYVPPPARA
jgi:hypothetical protein